MVTSKYENLIMNNGQYVIEKAHCVIENTNHMMKNMLFVVTIPSNYGTLDNRYLSALANNKNELKTFPEFHTYVP